jgi:hypothetical protein
MNEHELQKLAVAALRKIGFTCIVTSNRKHTANTKGCPDVFVYIIKGAWIALEFKQPKSGKASKEQLILSEQEFSYIIDSIDKAIEMCIKFRNTNTKSE